ncbi:MAG: Omp28-related outer membrane protein [Bacteroidetes bacterium]|nr:Omp28-related outer membrane protein [Bacteroidota bacterium]
MKNLYKFLLLFSFSSLFFSFESEAQAVRNPVLEYCTGTWCQYCPCGHTVIHDVIMLYNPNTVVLAYHGPTNSSDPFRVFAGNTIISAMGFSSYPTGIVDRLTAPQSRGAWAGQVSNRSYAPPKVSIDGFIGFEKDSNKIHVRIVVKALAAIAEIPVINFILTEDKLVATQTGSVSAGCIGGADYIHDNVVRSMLNGALGNELAKSGWQIGDSSVVDTFYYVPSNVASVNNLSLNAFVYSKKSPLNQSEIHQARKWKLSDYPVDVKDISNLPVPSEYTLGQNYPNPFNPGTKISFSIPKSGFVSLKVYDLTGKEVANILSGELNSGNYSVSYDASALPSGVYFYQLQAEGVKISRKMSLVK